MSKPDQSRAQILRDALEDAIVQGEFAPGQRLDESSLTERFGVSRTPVREALQQLAAVRLVEMIPKRGAFVTRIGLPELVEMFESMSDEAIADYLLYNTTFCADTDGDDDH